MISKKLFPIIIFTYLGNTGLNWPAVSNYCMIFKICKKINVTIKSQLPMSLDLHYTGYWNIGCVCILCILLHSIYGIVKNSNANLTFEN